MLVTRTLYYVEIATRERSELIIYDIIIKYEITDKHSVMITVW